MPARAPPSIDMLQTVIRPSIDSASIAEPQYSMTWPVPPAVPISPMMARMMSLAVTPSASAPSTLTRMFLALVWISVWVASTCSTSEVPMPWASAPKAPWVEVWLSPQTIVVPGRVKPCSGPMMWTTPCRAVELVVIFDAEFARVLGQLLDLLAALGIGDAAAAVGGLDVVVDDGERLFRRAHLAPGHAQALERLRARHFMDEMAVDVDEDSKSALGLDDMVVPDLVVQRTRLGHNALQRPRGANSGDWPLSMPNGARMEGRSREPDDGLRRRAFHGKQSIAHIRTVL